MTNEARDRTRREFLRELSWSTAALARGASIALPTYLAGCESTVDPGPDPPGPDPSSNPLRIPSAVAPQGLVLRASPGTADIGDGITAPVWLLNDVLPSPLIRARTGDPFRVILQNALTQDLIVHWHGMFPPTHSDGHPRFAVPPGETYEYDFLIRERASLYWYHPHTHHLTGEQTYRGMAGMIIVSDAEEDALQLPSGAREIPLVLQDRRVDAAGFPYYEPTQSDLRLGYMGPEIFGNGVHDAYVDVDTAVYRFRVLNGSNARIFRLARSDGLPLVMIGNDGGLLPAARTLGWLDLGPAERADLLIDLRGIAVGTSVRLDSLPFQVPGAGSPGGANLQGQPAHLLEIRVRRNVEDDFAMPGALVMDSGPIAADAVRERTFHFQSRMMEHTINGLRYELYRDDVHIPFGETEIWNLVNDSNLPHPVHLHATHFRVLSRTGGRGMVMPWEEGLKDTVLLHAFETVRIAVRFTGDPGLYLFHCHNLEHEDMGMMLNIVVE